MTSTYIVQNFEETRRKSIKLWLSVPAGFYDWRPDAEAYSLLEMVRHVLEAEYMYRIIVNNRGGHVEDPTPWTGRPFTNVQDELALAEPSRKEFLETISGFSDDDLNSIRIVRSGKITRTLGEFLHRCQYHESVHAGQFLSYLRTAGLDRPNIWE